MSATGPQDAVEHEVCYRHPDRAAGVTCQRCDRQICSSCMHQASVGFHCPECTSTNKQKVYNTRNLPGARSIVTRVLVGLNVVIWIVTIVGLGATINSAGPTVFGDFGTWGPPIAEGNEVWRIFSGGFLHSGLFHIGFNMYLLWQLGQQIERALGERDYIAVYLTSLIGGSLGALFLSPNSPTVGASGAVFGLIGFTVLFYRSRGIGLFDTGLGFLIVINILFSFRGGVSLGGHLGGFLAGLALGALYFGLQPGQGALVDDSKKRLGITILAGVIMFGLSVVAAMTWMNPIFG